MSYCVTFPLLNDLLNSLSAIVELLLQNCDLLIKLDLLFENLVVELLNRNIEFELHISYFLIACRLQFTQVLPKHVIILFKLNTLLGKSLLYLLDLSFALFLSPVFLLLHLLL
jgi:hypothetical protein